MRRLILLGPQRHAPCVRQAAEDVAPEGTLALVTAGWEEREQEDEELVEHLGGRARNLGLFQLAEQVFARDPELLQLLRGRHDVLRSLQRLYRLRLDHAIAPVREMLGHLTHGRGATSLLQGAHNGALDDDTEQDETELLRDEIEDALAALQTLDRQHVAHVREVHAQYEDRCRASERDAVVQARQAIERELDDCTAVLIAGGHVAVLLNRMRLLGLGPHLRRLPVVAWSAGAMVLTDQVVLFHDSPPQGQGHAEVLEGGLGLAPGFVVLPHARHRLLLDDPIRVQLLARRFAPAVCATFDPGVRVEWDGARWHPAPGTSRLTSEGGVAEFAG